MVHHSAGRLCTTQQPRSMVCLLPRPRRSASRLVYVSFFGGGGGMGGEQPQSWVHMQHLHVFSTNLPLPATTGLGSFHSWHRSRPGSARPQAVIAVRWIEEHKRSSLINQGFWLVMSWVHGFKLQTICSVQEEENQFAQENHQGGYGRHGPGMSCNIYVCIVVHHVNLKFYIYFTTCMWKEPMCLMMISTGKHT